MRLLLSALFALFVLAAVPLAGCGDGNCRAKGDPGVPVGGAFELVDTAGKTVTDDALKGKYRIVYFGFTYCPDICPTELQHISDALDKLGEGAARFTPVFVTVDPARDTPGVVGDYLQNFHPSFVGLTGTPEQIEKAAKAYRIYYAKAERPDAPDAYTMDHSSYIYVMDCEGRYIEHFNFGVSADEMATRLGKLL